MTAYNPSQRVSELSQLLEELQAKCVSNPANAPEILSSALESLQESLEELSAAEEELMQQNEELLRTQSELLEAEEARLFLASIVNSAEVAIIGKTPVGIIISWNAGAEKIYGYSADEAIGRPISILIPPGHIDEMPQILEKISRGEKVDRFETMRLRKDGRQIYVSLTVSPIINEHGVVVGASTIAADITECKRREDVLQATKEELQTSEEEVRLQNEELRSSQSALQKSEAKLRRLYESGLIGVIFWNMDGVIVDANDKFLEMIGYTRNDLTEDRIDWINMTPPEYRYLDEKSVTELKATGVNKKPFEKEYIRKDGTRIPIIIAGAMLDETRLNGIAIVLDITERKKAEEALQEANEELADTNEELAASNEELRSTTEELQKARNDLEFRVQERTAELSDAKENLEVINEELQVEISEHEKTEKELMAAKEAAEAAVEAKAAFLANMSHELRTPLNAVIGYSSLLLDDNLTQDQKEHIESIRNGGEALLALISNILEFSRAEKKKVTLEHQPFSLTRCIEESMDMVAVQADKKGLNLSYTISYGTQDTIIGDPGRLRQVLANLLNNAVKFTDKGNVSLSISSKVIENDKHQIRFMVKDTGIGMPQDKMGKIFEPFTQLEYVMSRKRDGAGLGLAISKKLVELMGGEIWANSEEGNGSTFGFTIQAETFPGEQLDLGEKDRAQYQNISAGKPLSILVAEDNPSNQRVLVDMLKQLGYRPDVVADGAEVILALVIRHYDLIFNGC
jgi:PAS domain S-box-containing protein